MLESHEPIEIKKGYHLRMELPNSFLRKPKIVFEAKSVWCKKDIDLESYKTGFQLQNLDKKVEKEINKVMEKFRFKC